MSFRIVDLDSARGQRALARLVRRGRQVMDRRVRRGAERIVDSVRRGGDRALLEAVARFDGSVDRVAAERVADLRLSPALVPADQLPAGFAAALETAIENVTAYHQRQVHGGFVTRRAGVTLEERREPLGRVGVYVPGGLAAYPSTVVMTVVPAQLAGVREIVVATPPRALAAQPALEHTLARLGVTEVWGMGGAQSIAALAFGTETIRRVDKIVGPGNAWVTAAKRQVAGDVGIDGLAGPTEVVVVADGSARADWLAADLLAQAEHDPRAAAILLTDDRGLARRVARELERQLPELATAETARAALAAFGTAFVTPSLEAAVDAAALLAPEHLQLVGARAEALADQVRNAGAIFVGTASGEVFGDYVAGPSHVLPTAGSARFASALGVEDFQRRCHVIRLTPAAARRLAPAAAALADAEGLPGHAAAARRRLES
ncbi:MAG: histidinol dehydrogenase [Thermoanaerobaculia bacterium]|nr:histidinol dehydrogenase [Thermoanaerobaculia bacterium]